MVGSAFSVTIGHASEVMSEFALKKSIADKDGNTTPLPQKFKIGLGNKRKYHQMQSHLVGNIKGIGNVSFVDAEIGEGRNKTNAATYRERPNKHAGSSRIPAQLAAQTQRREAGVSMLAYPLNRVDFEGDTVSYGGEPLDTRGAARDSESDEGDEPVPKRAKPYLSGRRVVLAPAMKDITFWDDKTRA